MRKILILVLSFFINHVAVSAESAPNDNASLYVQVTSHWNTLLASYQSTREHVRFFKEQNVGIIIIRDVENSLSGSILASYESDGIHINQLMIDEMATGLKNRGISDEEIPEIIALKTVDLIGHELRHGIDSIKLLNEYNIRFPIGYLEDEISGYVDQIYIIAEVNRKNPLFVFDDIYNTPEVDDNRKELLAAFEDGLSGIERYIKRYNTVPSVLSIDRIYFIKTLKNYLELNARGLGKIHDRMQALQLVDKTEEVIEELRRLDKIRSNYERSNEFLYVAISVLENEENYNKLLIFTKIRMNEVKMILSPDDGDLGNK